jgi:hypothetical protein
MLLGCGLDRSRVVLASHPTHRGRRWYAGKDGHAGKHRARPAEAADAPDLDRVATAGPFKCGRDLIRRSVTIGRESVVRPLDHLGRPPRLPAHIEIQPERSGRVLLAAIGYGRRPNTRAVRKQDIHSLSIGLGARIL